METPSDGQAGSDNRRVAFLATEPLSEADLAKSIQALERAGIRADLISTAPTPAGAAMRIPPAAGLTLDRVSPADYAAVAMPASPGPAIATGSNPGVLDFLRSMQEAGKPILYVPVPAAGAPGQQDGSAPAFSLKRLLVESWKNWNAIDAPRQGAALAYYTLLSMAPLLVLIMAIAGVFFRRTLIQEGLSWQVLDLTGNVGASVIRPLLENTRPYTGIIAGAIGLVTLLLGASGVFLELRNSLDVIWGVRPPCGTGLWSLVRERLFAFIMVLGTGVAASASILLTVILATPVRSLLRFVPTSGIVADGLSVILSLVIMTFVFALIYKIVPDMNIRWSDVWIGALVTSFLFTAGKGLIGLYLTKAGVGSAYAAAGSLVVFLTWVYYSMQIFLFGAEFTHEYAIRHGSRSLPARRAERLRRFQPLIAK